MDESTDTTRIVVRHRPASRRSFERGVERLRALGLAFDRESKTWSIESPSEQVAADLISRICSGDLEAGDEPTAERARAYDARVKARIAASLPAAERPRAEPEVERERYEITVAGEHYDFVDGREAAERLANVVMANNPDLPAEAVRVAEIERDR